MKGLILLADKILGDPVFISGARNTNSNSGELVIEQYITMFNIIQKLFVGSFRRIIHTSGARDPSRGRSPAW